MPILKIKKTVKDIDSVGYSKPGDAGIDLRASGHWIVDIDSEKKELEQEEYELLPGKRILAKTGIQIEIPNGFWGNIRDRSGMAANHGLHCLGGVIDETYRGEIMVPIVNLGKNPYKIRKNDRIAQMVIAPYVSAEISYEENLTESERGSNGFGSSGKR